jgi:hypothetical protein
MRKIKAVWHVFVIMAAFTPEAAHGEKFVFGFAANDLNGLASKSLTNGEFTMQVSAGPAGGLLYESNGAPGLGIGTSGVIVTDGEHTVFDMGSTGAAEFIQFSFDRPGVLTGLDFDGVKDENYEYFLLQTATSPDLYFFDSFENSTANPGLINVPGQVIFLQEFHGPDDAVTDLGISFAAGQPFKLTYGQLNVGLTGNGARLQSISVGIVPEPSTPVLTMLATIAVLSLRRRER